MTLKNGKIAINDEISNMYNNNIMKIIDKVPKNANIIDTKSIFTIKDNNKKKSKISGLRFSINSRARFRGNLIRLRFKQIFITRN